jgi:hypothetical protein
MFFEKKSAKNAFRIEPWYPDDYEFPVCAMMSSQAAARWDIGERIDSVDEPVDFQIDKPLDLVDNMRWYGGGLLVSSRLFSFLSAHSSCVLGYRARIFHGNDLVSADYFAVNFERSFPCLYSKKAKFSIGKKSGVKFLSKIALAEKRLPSEGVFRLGEVPVYLIASEQFRSGFMASGLIGLRFEPIDVYVGT